MDLTEAICRNIYHISIGNGPKDSGLPTGGRVNLTVASGANVARMCGSGGSFPKENPADKNLKAAVPDEGIAAFSFPVPGAGSDKRSTDECGAESICILQLWVVISTG